MAKREKWVNMKVKERVAERKENMYAIKKPKKIYLDQKDYSCIAKGLSGDSNFQEDVKVYDFLVPLVKSGKIVVYFSWCHLSEALRYTGEQTDLLNFYCKVMETLSQNKCIIWPEEIRKRELELFLSHNFHFTTNLSESDYPYGESTDALLPAFSSNVDFNNEIMKSIRKEIWKGINNLPLAEKQKQCFLKYSSKPENLKKLLAKMSKSDFLSSLYNQYPGLKNVFTEKTIETFFKCVKYGNGYNGFTKSIFTFKNLVLYFSRQFPEFKGIGRFFDSDSGKLASLVAGSQFLYGILGRQAMKENNLKSDLVRKFVDSFNDDISQLTQKYHFPIEEAKKALFESKFNDIPSINATITFCIEYYKRHKGNLERGRKPLSSDIMDIYHSMNLPYVDYYLTDRFFTEVVKSGEKLFKTKVLRNLTELKSQLEKEIG